MTEKNMNIPRLSATSAPASRQGGRVSMAKAWLSENYEIRVNLLDPTRVYLEARDENPIKYEFPVTEADIYLHAQEDEIPMSMSMLRTLLQSPNQITAFNPITEYFESLKGKYTGPSQIDLLVGSLHVTGDDDGGRARHLLRKWLCATAACALGYRQNDVALGLVSAEAGIGKTTFFEELVPPCLKDYYQCVLKGDTSFLPTRGFATRLLLNFDEMAAVTQANEDSFKQLLSSTEVTTRLRGSYRVETVPRVASVCFTSNWTGEMGGFIRIADQGMLRRLAVIELDAIDDYRQQFDVDQLWAEVMLLLNNGDYGWTQEEYRQFSSENLQYVVSTNAMRLLKLYYRQPESGDKPVFMTAGDIVMQLKHERKITSILQQVDEVRVGLAMRALGYKRRVQRIDGRGPRWGYDVVPMFDS